MVACDLTTSDLPADPRLEAFAGDIADPDLAARIVGSDTRAVVHLAAVVSGAAERDFDLGMRANVGGTSALLEACRRLRRPPHC